MLVGRVTNSFVEACNNGRAMSSEYRALVAKVESFTDSVRGRRQADLACAAGCASCCHAWLSVSLLEAAEVRGALAALDPTERARVRERGLEELSREQAGADDPRCAMLDDEGCCSVYAARPLVCRTQGHALRYPSGFIPAQLVMQRRTNGDVTWCPLNYTASEPSGADVLDAERVDQILGLVTQRHVGPGECVADARTSLSALAAERDVLHDGTVEPDRAFCSRE